MNAWELYLTKVAFAVAVASVGILGTILPWLLDRGGAGQRALALSDTFAGGVLGGAGLIHLLGAGISQFRASLPNVAYPLALLLAGVGFLLILLIEGVIVSDHWRPEAERKRDRSVAIQHEAGWNGRQSRAFYPAILLIVLSVHSIILGFALGAQQALAGAIIVFLAIIAHKGAAGFALGVGYARTGVGYRRALPQLAFFATMTPLGILVGGAVGLSLAPHADRLFEAIFDSLGAGTFLYIAALDIIKTQFESPGYRLQKWLSAVSGFSVMALLAIWL